METLLSLDLWPLHWVRPQAFWALCALPLVFWAFRAGAAGRWQKHVDTALRQHVLTASKPSYRWAKRFWLLLAWLLAIVALAGPSWEQRPTPVLRNQAARVVVLDLSTSMAADDIKPSRLVMARLKARDVLAASRDGKAGLVVFAAQAFAIAPLTDDMQTLAAQIPVLSPGLMPAQGGRVDRALARAEQLLKQAGASQGQVLLITDSQPQAQAYAMAERLAAAGMSLSVLGVGTRKGAPIPSATGFVKDKNGNIVVPSLPVNELAHLAKAGGGRYRSISADNSDIESLLEPMPEVLDRQQKQEQMSGDRWTEAGPWLLLFLLPWVALGYRRGWLLSLAWLVCLPMPNQAVAKEGGTAWLTPDQQAYRQLESKPKQAAELFVNPDWRAAAQYQAGDYAQAAEYWRQQTGAEARFNLGNALAHSGDLQAAIQAWEQVPEDSELAAHANANAEIIKALLPPPEQQNQQQGEKQGSESKDSENQVDKRADSEQPSSEASSGQQDDSRQQSQPNPNQAQSSDAQAEENQAGADNMPNDNKQTDNKQTEDVSENQNGSEDDSADEALSEQDAQAADQQAEQEQTSEQASAEKISAAEQAEKQAQQQVVEQWLNRVPDDPGGLLRNKFARDYQRGQQRGPLGRDNGGQPYQDEEQAW